MGLSRPGDVKEKVHFGWTVEGTGKTHLPGRGGYFEGVVFCGRQFRGVGRWGSHERKHRP